MVRGGRVAALRDRRILRVITELSRLDFLPDYAASELTAAYQFLRIAENRLQQMNDRQVHALPEATDARATLAAGAGFSSWAGFEHELDRHRSRVSAHFLQVLGAPEASTDGPEDPLEAVWRGTLTDEPALEALSLVGFSEPAEATEKLRRFAESYPIRRLDERGGARLHRLMPNLLRVCARLHPADSTLARTIHEFGKKEGLRCVRKTLLQALSHTQEAFTWETIPHDSL